MPGDTSGQAKTFGRWDMPVADKKAAFQDRLKRINSGRQFEHADVVGVHTQKAFNKKYAPKLKKPRRTFGQNLMVLVAFLCGISAVTLGRTAYFHISRIDGVPEALVNLEGRGVLLFFLVIAGTMTAMLGLSTRSRMQALALGSVFMYYGEAAVAASAPDLWGQIFSPDYTASLIEHAPAAGVAG
jgi:hypothetical protein